jgi:hypothetical protein
VANPDPLKRVTARLDRAEEHLKSLDDALRRFLKKRPYKFLPPEDHPEIKQIWYRAQVKDQIPIECSAMVGDAVHNMRAALDNLVYALAIEKSAQDPPPHDGAIAFPILDDPKFWKPDSHKIGAIDCRAKAIIESMQPYHRRHDFRNHPLCVLQNLDNIDKHRFLHIVGMAVSSADVDFSVPVSGMRMWLTEEPLCRDAVVAKLDYSRAAGRGQLTVDVNMSFGVGVVFDEPGVNTKDSAQIILEDVLLAYVRDVVVAKLKRFFPA